MTDNLPGPTDYPCPYCGSTPGYQCRGKRGQAAGHWVPPHLSRWSAFLDDATDEGPVER